jgi:hypothetical protein
MTITNLTRLGASPRAVAAAIGLLAVAACSAPPGTEEGFDDGPSEYVGNVPGASGAQNPAPAPGAGTPSNTGVSPVAGGGEQNQSGGAPIAPPSSTPPASSGNTSGANNGAGGSTAAPANNGAGGSSMVPEDGAGGATTMPPAQQPPAQQPPAQQPPAQQPPAQQPPAQQPPAQQPPAQPAGPDIPCPADATFCSGFEGSALPDDAIYQGNPALEFDTAVRRSGNQSIVFRAVDGFNIREVVAPIPGQAFWVRLFIQTSTEFGDNDHDSLFVASTANFEQDNNAESGPEFSEQGNQIIINSDDQLFSAAGPGFPQGDGPTLSPNTWHCVEAFFDGGSGDVQFFADSQQLIDAPGFAPRNYQTFRFGYLQFPGHVPHVVHYDDVVVASNRVGCN